MFLQLVGCEERRIENNNSLFSIFVHVPKNYRGCFQNFIFFQTDELSELDLFLHILAV